MSTVLITGANRGIGLALARLYTQRGDTVIAAVRTASGGLQETGAQLIEGVDVTKDDLKALTDGVGETSIDVLICNAGVLSAEHLGALDLAAIRYQFEVNTLGPLKVVAALRGNLAEGAKEGLVTSRMGSIADNTSGGMYGYRISKAALNMVGVSLAQDLKRDNVAVALLHPGFVKTEMTRGNGNVTPDVSAAGLAARIDALALESSGSFWHAEGQLLPW